MVLAITMTRAGACGDALPAGIRALPRTSLLYVSLKTNHEFRQLKSIFKKSAESLHKRLDIGYLTLYNTSGGEI